MRRRIGRLLIRLRRLSNAEVDAIVQAARADHLRVLDIVVDTYAALADICSQHQDRQRLPGGDRAKPAARAQAAGFAVRCQVAISASSVVSAGGGKAPLPPGRRRELAARLSGDGELIVTSAKPELPPAAGREGR